MAADTFCANKLVTLKLNGKSIAQKNANLKQPKLAGRKIEIVSRFLKNILKMNFAPHREREKSSRGDSERQKFVSKNIARLVSSSFEF